MRPVSVSGLTLKAHLVHNGMPRSVRRKALATEAPGFYDDPTIYDILHSPGTGQEVEVLECLHARHLPERDDGIWLEPACGSGRFLRVLAGRDRRVAGFDLSSSMIRYARQRLRSLGLQSRARLRVADMSSFAPQFEAESVSVAFNTINTIRHLTDDASFRAHFEQMAQVLRPDGIYVVGISISAYDQEEASEDTWEGARGSCRVRQVVQYIPPTRRERVEEVYSHLAITRPRGTETRDDRYGLRAFNRRQWRKLLLSSKLEILEVTSDRGEAMQDHDGNYFLYVLRHRG